MILFPTRNAVFFFRVVEEIGSDAGAAQKGPISLVPNFISYVMNMSSSCLYLKRVTTPCVGNWPWIFRIALV